MKILKKVIKLMLGLAVVAVVVFLLSTPKNTPAENAVDEAKAAMDATSTYIKSLEKGGAASKLKLVDLYCNEYETAPVNNYNLVKSNYNNNFNCNNVGMPMLRDLANIGDYNAQLALAHALNSTLSDSHAVRATPNDEEALGWYTKVAKDAPPDVQTESAFPGSVKAIAAMWAGSFYETGRGTTKNPQLAFKFHKQAAELGHETSILKIAEMYKDGKGVEKDENAALFWYKKLPESETAQLEMSEIYLLKDSGVSDQYDKALLLLNNLYENSKEEFNRHEASYYLGVMYFNGLGVTRNYKTAYDYFLDAARWGESQAQKYMAILYGGGLGTIQDWKEAEKWAVLSAANGNEFVLPLRQAIESRMTGADIQEAKAMATDWGQHKHVEAFSCQFGSRNVTFKIDHDTLKLIDSNDGILGPTDVVERGNELKLLGGSYGNNYSINRFNGSAVMNSSGFGTCAIAKIGYI